ncbi:MAG: DegV family EDD domain-containing protein, partial [Oscillibacter sp.]|nr:DegV family EDD domain-containing protein [Oscillibacter sp.]
VTMEVFDSKSGALGQGMTVLQLAKDIAAGMEWDELTRVRAPRLIENTFPFFSLDTLKYLQKGGRIGKVTAMAGAMLHIKPILTFTPDGELCSVAKVRGSGQLTRKLLELVTERRGNCAHYNLAVEHGGAPEAMEKLRAQLTAVLPDYENLWDGHIDGTLSTYIGSGVLGAAIQRLD